MAITLKLINENIFLAIEYYLAYPSTDNANRIKSLSDALYLRAYQAAQISNPKKSKIGADEYQPELLSIMEEHAEQARINSIRFIHNLGYDKSNPRHENDRQYIFKLSEQQKDQINTLKSEMLSQKGTNILSPDGLVFAFAGYIERYRPRVNPSTHTYCDSFDALVYDHNAKLNIKRLELQERGFDSLVLGTACRQIQQVQFSSNDSQTKRENIISILNDLVTKPEIQEHRGIIKQVLVNFLIAITGIGLLMLMSTAAARNSFWYRSNTDTGNKVEEFHNELSAPFEI